MANADHHHIANIYHRFAAKEAHDRSPLYEAFAHGVATDATLLALLADLPTQKRQPNLLLAAVRLVTGVARDWDAFRDATLTHWSDIRAVILNRSTQTNEPGRCATLLPALARLPQPLALIEVGASAGLCLLPDRYAYRYGEHLLRPDGSFGGTPLFPCRASSNTPLPAVIPNIVWQAGIDLNPLNVADSDHMTWLETLIWPEQIDRADRFRGAVRVAQANPPRLLQGDLRHDLAMLAAEAPKGVTLVVFHTAVLTYVVSEAERRAFAGSVSAVCDYWISNEALHCLPEIAAQAPIRPPGNWFLMALNGKPIAWTDPHGAAIEWIEAENDRPVVPSPSF
jgi:hypothetical protein